MPAQRKHPIYIDFFKPFIDFIIAFIVFSIASPVFLLLVIFLFWANKGKPFFLQPRPGKGERIFKVIKFKTMNDARDAAGNLLPDAQRLTAIGSFVRKTSLDELPQLLNVLTGSMSLVGPRPLLVEYLPLYDAEQRKRHLMKPGITGWAQINGRNTLSWEKKFEYDVYYVEHASFAFDMKILLLTLKKVVKSDGINSATSATMEKFTGTTAKNSQS
jgi:undecaprenyl phosphate N,N'-diacetylbacillosamine 1-phosphate transferase